MNLNRRHFITAGSLTALAAGLFIPKDTTAREIVGRRIKKGFVEVLLKTNRYKPPADVSLRVEAIKSGKLFTLRGTYQDSNWVFSIPTDKNGEQLKLTFLLNGDEYSDKSSTKIRVNATAFYQFDTDTIQLSLLDVLAQSRNIMAERLFPEQKLEQIFDVVIVGSGMGGGVLADQLASAGLNVAVLEAGSMLFPTHVGNLPRMTKLGKFSKHIWDLWYRYGIKNYRVTKGTEFYGPLGYNIGGRSIFWGAFIPQMKAYEFEGWPDKIKNYMLTSGYEKANRLVKKSTFANCEFQEVAKEIIGKSLQKWNVIDAPVAIDYAKSGCQTTLPTGVFSTADLVMESILTGVESNINYPKVFQRHPAININHKDRTITGIQVIDLDNDQFKTVKGKAYVLAAGTQESAKLAINSRLEPSTLIGKNISDHPVFYTHFGLASDNPLFRDEQSAKIVLQDPLASATRSPFNIIIELGADLNHGRFVDPEVRELHQAKKEMMLCEVVFLVDMQLDKRNSLTVPNRRFYEKPLIDVKSQPGLVEYRNQIIPVQKAILTALNAKSLPGKNLDLVQAPPGNVAHEVGTLRMEGNDRSNSQSSVVDSNLRFHQYENLWACDLSVFPTSPAANPSLTLIALAIRLAERLKQQMSTSTSI
jgi:hypothetical protein